MGGHVSSNIKNQIVKRYHELRKQDPIFFTKGVIARRFGISVLQLKNYVRQHALHGEFKDKEKKEW